MATTNTGRLPRTPRPWVKLAEWRLDPGEDSGVYAQLLMDAETKETTIDVRFWRGRPGRGATIRSWAGIFLNPGQQAKLEEAFRQANRMRTELVKQKKTA